MKARGNEKPRKKYHKFITKLLEDPRIVHIWGGGYAPHRNFHFEDLTPEEQIHILKLKPDLVFDPLEKIPSNHKLPEKHMREVDDHNSVIERLRKASGVKTLTPEVLKQVALKDSRPGVRWEAVLKLQDQEVLKQVALKDENSYVREAAVQKIQDQEVLKEVALKDKSWSVRKIAVQKLS